MNLAAATRFTAAVAKAAANRPIDTYMHTTERQRQFVLSLELKIDETGEGRRYIVQGMSLPSIGNGDGTVLPNFGMSDCNQERGGGATNVGRAKKITNITYRRR
jgi:hypothetical protein